jgi:hypothetical protein
VTKVQMAIMKLSDKTSSELLHSLFLAHFTDSQNAFESWGNGKISNDDLLLIINTMQRRTVVDLRHFPYFPLQLDCRRETFRRQLRRFKSYGMLNRFVSSQSASAYSSRRLRKTTVSCHW